MELTKGVTVEYKEGAIVLKAEVASVAKPVLADIKAKIESGEIDPIKGTDFDKLAMLQVLAAIEAVL